jgi:hypothetical protein
MKNDTAIFGLFFYLQKPRPSSGIKLIGLCEGTMNCSHIFAFDIIDGFIAVFVKPILINFEN